jgi:ABC-type antimicrobial peptide transport system permease subunit
MLQIILKSAWRQIWKNRAFSTINILGLAVGLSVAILAGLWVNQQFQYDRFHADGDRIYQAMMDYIPTGGEMGTFPAMPMPLVNVLKEETPGVETVAATDWGGKYSLVYGEKRLRKEGLFVQPAFLDIFTFPLVAGDAKTALNNPNQIIISEEVATAIFGDANPIGQTLSIDNDVDVMVSGVMKNVPATSSLKFDFLLPFALNESRQPWMKDALTNWGNSSFQIYFKLEPQANIASVQALHRNVFIDNSDMTSAYLGVHALNDWHLYAIFEEGKAVSGLIRYVKLFGIIGALVLLIACINFVNISTARAEKRSKEVGVRKAIGAGRSALITQFLGEAGVTMLLAFGLSLLLVGITLPHFNTLVDESIRFPWLSPLFWGMAVSVLLVSTLLAGSYPAFYLTRFEAKEALQKTFQTGRGNNIWSRRALVCLQFTVSIALIAGSLIVHKQVQFAQQKDKGYNQERLLSVINTPGISQKYDVIKTELLASNMAEKVTASGSPITSVWSNMGNIFWPGRAEDEQVSFAFIATSPDYFETLELTFKEGRAFSAQYPADTTTMILNEAAVKRMGLEDPLSTVLTWNEVPFRVIGVVQDVIMETPFEPVRPTVFSNNPDWKSAILLRLNEGQPTDKALATVASIFEKHDPATPFSYDFVEEEYNRKFSSTNFVGTVALLFAGLAIFLSALGLLGLAIYLAERRAKEISIRKIFGASVTQLWLLLSSEFMLIILIGGLLAIPLGAYFLQGWLDNFTYRIDFPWIVFVLAGGIALFIALATISVQSIKAALVNPAKRLRDE